MDPPVISPLAEELKLPCGVVIPNRILKSAMTEGLAGPDGIANEQHCQLYRAWSHGGAGLLISGNVMVDRRFLERPGNVVIEGGNGADELAAWAQAGTEAGNQLWMQISHPGRQCSRAVSGEPLAPSAVQLKLMGYFARPRAMTAEEIRHAVVQYVGAASHAQAAGFTGVQIHAAHGYLLSQFLSPVTNQRTDEWGGSLENRARLLLDVVRAVRAEVGSAYPVAIKLNSADFQKGGFTLEESMQVAKWLQDEGIDLLEISGGTYEQLRLLGRKGHVDDVEEPQRTSTRRREAYFLEYAQAIRTCIDIPLAVTGGFRNRTSMEGAVRNDGIDMIGLARPLCVEPDLPLRILEQRIEDAPGWEDHLRLGPGLLDANSPIDLLKAINAQGMVAWFYRQIIQISRGQPARLELGLPRALMEHLYDEIRNAIARRRLLRSLATAADGSLGHKPG